jgi:hypothetical protein
VPLERYQKADPILVCRYSDDELRLKAHSILLDSINSKRAYSPFKNCVIVLFVNPWQLKMSEEPRS